MSYFYKMQLFVMDKSVPNDSNLYIIFLCSIENRGAEFINVDFGREEPSEEKIMELKRIHKKLTRPWMEVDLLVEAVEVEGKQPIFFVVDTALTI